MGTSTDAILFYGYVWDDEDRPNPWPDADGDGDEPEDWEARLARLSGLTEPTVAFTGRRFGPGGVELPLSPEEQAADDAWGAYFTAQSALVAATGCTVRHHCSGDYPMPYVAIAWSVTMAWRGFPVEITGLAVKPEWREMLDAFCRTMGIDTAGKKLGWWLVSYWG